MGICPNSTMIMNHSWGDLTRTDWRERAKEREKNKLYLFRGQTTLGVKDSAPTDDR